MRIGIVHPRLVARGGADNVAVWLAAELAARGHDVTLAASGLQPDLWPEVSLAGVTSIDLPRRGPLAGWWAHARRVGRELAGRAGPLDVLLASNPPASWWVALASERLAPRPCTVHWCHEPARGLHPEATEPGLLEYLARGRQTLPDHEHLVAWFRKATRRSRGWRRRRRRALDARLVGCFDEVVANSAFTAGTVLGAWGRTVPVIHPGVLDPGVLEPPDPARRSGVAVLTGFKRHKNPFGVLGAIAELARRGRDDIHFTLLGADPGRAHLDYLRAHGIGRSVTLAGWLSEERKGALLAESRLCLFVPFSEPFGLVPVEALLRGTPVVASREGGPAEIVADGVTGRLVDAFDPASIAEGILELHDDPGRLREMAVRGAAEMRSRFLIPLVAGQFEALLAGRRPVRAGRTGEVPA
jgi:glycosyltransferase involved in cell wall biosynthesis